MRLLTALLLFASTLLLAQTSDEKDAIASVQKTFDGMAAHDAASRIWDETALTPHDVDVAELYDGFTYLTLQWLEAFGFCHIREGIVNSVR